METFSPEFSSSVPPVKKAVENYLHGPFTHRIIGVAIDVHDGEALSHEPDRQQIGHHHQVPIRIHYRGVAIGMHRLDFVFDAKSSSSSRLHD